MRGGHDSGQKARFLKLINTPMFTAYSQQIRRGVFLVAAIFAAFFILAALPKPANAALPTLERIGKTNDFSNYSEFITIHGNYAYVPTYKRMNIIDISNPSKPLLAGWYDFEDHRPSESAVSKDGKYLYVSGSEYQVHILNVSDKSNVQLVGWYDVGASTSSIAISADGTTMYVANAYEMHICDISGDPTYPVKLSEIGYSFVKRMIPSSGGKYLYMVRSTDGFSIADVSNPSNPVHITTNDDISFAVSDLQVSIDEKYAYVIGGDYLNVVDMSNKLNPVRISRFESGSGTRGVGLAGSMAYVTSHSGLYAIDVSTPTTPRRKVVNTDFTLGKRLEAIGDKVYAPGYSNLSVFKYDPNPVTKPSAGKFVEKTGKKIVMKYSGSTVTSAKVTFKKNSKKGKKLGRRKMNITNSRVKKAIKGKLFKKIRTVRRKGNRVWGKVKICNSAGCDSKTFILPALFKPELYEREYAGTWNQKEYCGYAVSGAAGLGSMRFKSFSKRGKLKEGYLVDESKGMSVPLTSGEIWRNKKGYNRIKVKFSLANGSGEAVVKGRITPKMLKGVYENRYYGGCDWNGTISFARKK